MSRQKSQSLVSLLQHDVIPAAPTHSGVGPKSASHSVDGLNRSVSTEKIAKSNERGGFNADALAIAIENLPPRAAAAALSSLVPAQVLLTLKSMKTEQSLQVAAFLSKETQQAFKESMDSEQIMGFNLLVLTKDIEITSPEQTAIEVLQFPPEQAAQVIKSISSDEKRNLVLLHIYSRSR